MKLLDYSLSWEYLMQPNIVEYDGGKNTKPGFDLILGTNTLKELGILNFWTKEIDINEIILPMRDITKLSTRAKIERAWTTNNSIMAHEPKSTLDATNGVIKILDAKFEKADLKAVVKDNWKHSSVPKQTQLLKLLTKFEELFDGTLDDWDTELVSFQLNEGARPYHDKLFPILKGHKDIIKKEVQRLCEFGVLKWQPESEWASPLFTVPKKNQTVWLISDCREVSKKIVRNPFPIPKISTVLQELEGFTYATAFNLNVGYYTIRLDPNASKICTIIFPWGKYSYLWLPMGIVGSPDIF